MLRRGVVGVRQRRDRDVRAGEQRRAVERARHAARRAGGAEGGLLGDDPARGDRERGDARQHDEQGASEQGSSQHVMVMTVDGCLQRRLLDEAGILSVYTRSGLDTTILCARHGGALRSCEDACVSPRRLHSWDSAEMPDTLPPTPAASPPEAANVAAHAGASHIEVLELMSDLLLGVGEGSPPDAFFSSLCEAICRLTSMKRAVLVRYDRTRRRVRAVGAHGIELDVFADLFVTIDSVPVAREALAGDRDPRSRRRRRLQGAGGRARTARGRAHRLHADGRRRALRRGGAVRAPAGCAGDGRGRAPPAVDARQGDRDGVGRARGDRL